MNPQSVNSDNPCNLTRSLGALSGRQERRAKAFMVRDLSRSLRISEIAEHCNLSRSHFSRAFKIVTGYSPQEWMMKMKIDKAKKLLLTSMPITDIVYECGFADHSHFTRTFGRLVGISPKGWRQAVRSIQAKATEQNSDFYSPGDNLANPNLQTHAPELRY